MNHVSVKGIVRNGRVELEESTAIPEGTAVVVTAARHDDDEDWDNTPEGIADWLRWYESLEPLIFTAEEQADTEAWLRRMDAYSGATMDKGIEDLFR